MRIDREFGVRRLVAALVRPLKRRRVSALQNTVMSLIAIPAGLAIYVASTGAFFEAVLPSVVRKRDTPALNAPDSSTRARLSKQYGKLPLSFEVNRGQSDTRVKFLSRGRGYTLFLTPTEAVLSLSRDQGAGIRKGKSRVTSAAVLQMKFVGANANPKLEGVQQLPGESNYFIGGDPKKWRTGVPHYARVRYRGVYPGIDLIFYGNQRQLEFDFEVAPGADPGPILLAFDGTETPALDAQGALLLHIPGGSVRMPKPRVYQKVNGTEKEVACAYVIHDKLRVSFGLASYDRSQPLVIDPTLAYATYLGGNLFDVGNAIAADVSGSAYVTGETTSINFPTRTGALQSTASGGNDAFVTKLNVTGTAFVYSTYLGGNASDQGNGIALDAAGNAYVTGTTTSTNFPTTSGAFQTTSGGLTDSFVTKLNAAGSGLVYSTYLRSAADELAQAIAVDVLGNAYVTGLTNSTTFPTTVGAFQTTNRGGFDGFVTKLNSAGSVPVYSTYLGGGLDDLGAGIAIDNLTGSAFITGQTFSANFPTMTGAFRTVNSGLSDVFVTKLNSGGTGLVYSSYLGGSQDEFGSGIASDSSGNAYITGATNSANFPTTVGAFQTTNGGFRDAFVTKLNPAGSALVYSTYVGGCYDDIGYGIGVDSVGMAYITGSTVSADFPRLSAMQFQLGSDYGVFASFDDGANWFNTSSSGLTASEVNALATNFDPFFTILFAGTECHGVFGTFDGWIESNFGMPSKPSVRALAIHPGNPNKIFSGQSCTGVFVSMDGGFTWIECNNGLSPSGSRCVNALALHPTITTILYAGTNAGVFKSTDGAGTWSAVNTGLATLTVNTLAIDPLTPTTLYAGTTNGAFKSINSGTTWSLLGAPPAQRSLVIDPVTTTTLYAATGIGVFKSTDGGNTWSFSNSGLGIGTTNTLAIHPITPTMLYAGTNNGVFKTTNSGTLWAPAGTGFGFNTIVKTLVIDPAFPAEIYAGLGLPDSDGFITILEASGALLNYSTYIGGPDYDSGFAIAVDPLDNFYVTGWTQWANFPVTTGAAQLLFGGADDAFIMAFGTPGFAPSLDIALNKKNYVPGDTVTATQCRFVNSGVTDKAAEVKLWLGMSGIPPISLLDVGGDGSFVFPAGWSYDAGPFPLFTVTSSMTEGNYELSARLLDPVGGNLISEDLNVFTVSTGVRKPRTFTGDPPPRVELALSKSTYGNGETVTTSEVRLKNPGSNPILAEIKLCLVGPGLAPISIMNLGASGTFSLPGGYNQNLGPMTLLTVTPGMQRGNYELSARVIVPVTGKSLSLVRNHFEVR